MVRVQLPLKSPLFVLALCRSTPLIALTRLVVVSRVIPLRCRHLRIVRILVRFSRLRIFVMRLLAFGILPSLLGRRRNLMLVTPRRLYLVFPLLVSKICIIRTTRIVCGKVVSSPYGWSPALIQASTEKKCLPRHNHFATTLSPIVVQNSPCKEHNKTKPGTAGSLNAGKLISPNVTILIKNVEVVNHFPRITELNSGTAVALDKCSDKSVETR